MLNSTREKYLRRALKEIEYLAVSRRKVIEDDNEYHTLSAHERFAARILAAEVTNIYKGLRQAFIQAELDTETRVDELDKQKNYIKTISSGDITKIDLETFVMRKTLIKEAEIRANREAKLKTSPIPRGNPTKGGLVRKLIASGLAKTEANFEADRQLKQTEEDRKISLTMPFITTLSETDISTASIKPMSKKEAVDFVLRTKETQDLKDQHLMDVLSSPDSIESKPESTDFEDNFQC
jgi:hypothetical protein